MKRSLKRRQAGKSRRQREIRCEDHGFTLVELMIVLVIFSVVMAGLYSVYSVQVRSTMKEYKLAQSEMEFQIARAVIERDIAMAGSGIADTYCNMTASVASSVCMSGLQCNDPSAPSYRLCVPVHLRATPALFMMGTALGRDSRAAQAWSITSSSTPTSSSDYKSWADPRENLQTGDQIIYMNPNTKSLLYNAANNKWLFPFPPPDTNNLPDMSDDGQLVFGLVSSGTASVPYYVVDYSLGGTMPSNCAPGTKNLLRRESATDPASGSGQPLINCVLDYKVALGLDVNGDGAIDCWDNSGATCASGYPNETLRKQLKQVKMYILVQEGNRDANYTFSQGSVRVGDDLLTQCALVSGVCTTGAGGVGANVALTDEQRHFRWKMISLDVTPRNIR